MSLWPFYRKMFLERPAPFILTTLLSLAFWSIGLALGLVMREFFDRLTGDASVLSDLWVLIGVYLVVGIFSEAAMLLFRLVQAYYFETLRAALRTRIFEGLTGNPPNERGPRAGPGWLGVSWRSGRTTRPRDRRRGHCTKRRRTTRALDGDRLSWSEGKFCLQRGDNLLGAGPCLAAGTHAAMVALVAAARP